MAPVLQKKQRVEKSESDVKCDPDVPGYKQPPECSNAQSMSEAAEALANHEMTLEDLNKMSSDNAILLGTCQMVKYEQDNGAAAMKQWTEDFVDEVASAASASDVVSIQEAMIKEGYSCTFQEMNQVTTTGKLGEE